MLANDRSSASDLTPDQAAIREKCIAHFWDVYGMILNRMQQDGRLEQIPAPQPHPSTAQSPDGCSSSQAA